MKGAMRPAYDELVAELITLRAVLDARKFVRIARAADDAIDRALSGAGGVKSETENDGRQRAGTRSGHSHGSPTAGR